MKKLIFIAFFISGLCSALFAQTDKATVEGVVRDSDGKPLSFATMFMPNSERESRRTSRESFGLRERRERNIR